MSAARQQFVSRRQALSAMLGALAGCLVPGLAVRAQPRPLDACLHELAASVPGGARLGRKYLDRQPEEASIPWLEQQLLGTAEAGPCERISRHELKERLVMARAADFRGGRLVVLEGWSLARTEARLLALMALHIS